MKLVHIKNPNFEVMKKIVEIEQEAFEGAGNVDLWIVKALIRYGMVFVIEEDNKIVCIVEYMQIFNKKSLFLYGISTLKKYRHKGYANYILNETEKILKDLDYKEIELTVAPENEIAINLYKKHGYIQEKFLKDEYGEGIHRYMMRKKLWWIEIFLEITTNKLLNETAATSYNVEQAFWSLRNIIGCQVVDIYQKEQSYRCISRKIKLFLLQKFRKLLDI